MQLARLDGVLVKNLRYKLYDARSSLAYSVFFLFNQYFKLRPFSHILTWSWKPDIGRYPFKWQPLHKSWRQRMLSSYFCQTYQFLYWTIQWTIQFPLVAEFNVSFKHTSKLTKGGSSSLMKVKVFNVLWSSECFPKSTDAKRVRSARCGGLW